MAAISVAEELNRRFGVPGLATVGEGNGALPRVQVTCSKAEGELYLHGAQVTSWKPAGYEEMLFLSTKSRWQEGQAIRGGIPICFPWFRGKVNDARAPTHGFVRTKTWQLESIVEDDGRIAVSTCTESDEQARRWWPGDFHLLHRVVFGSELTLDLTCTNTGATPLCFEEALHTYNRVADVGRVRVRGLNSVRFLDNTKSNLEEIQHGDVIIAAPTDIAYLMESDVDLLDASMGRRIRLRKVNSLSTVVWNPWQEGAGALRDLGDDEWKQFLCVEASNILGAAIDLAPGQEHKMTAVLSVAKL